MPRRQILLLILLVISSGRLASSQTAEELLKRFNPRTDYELTHSVLMTPKFDSSGQLCSVILQPNRYAGNVVRTGLSPMSGREIEEALNLLVPANERGDRAKFWGMMDVNGQAYHSTYDFTRIGVTLFGAINSGGSATKKNMKVFEEKAMLPSAEVAEIRWKDGSV